MRMTWVIMALALATPAQARTPHGAGGPGTNAHSTDTHSTDTTRTAAALDRIADSPPGLRIFLQAMPKGGDLHNHMGGSIYAEDFLAWAGEDGLCLDAETYRVVAPPCAAPGRIAAAGLERDYPHYSAAINAFSTRGFADGVGNPEVSGYDRFFATFETFGAAGRTRNGDILARTREQAAADHASYVEFSGSAHRSVAVAGAVAGMDGEDFAGMAARLAPLLPAAIADARAEFDAMEARADALDGCKTTLPQPACGVAVRYLYTAYRTVPPAPVFAQMVLGFAMVEADPRFVGVNIAAPEHDPVAVRDYALHMRMFAWLKARHPGVKLSLHAGELTLGLVPPRDLAFHIHDAIAVAGAQRIGHGIDISYETDAPALLARMARDHIDVEINLTSNAVILGIKGRDHPLALYRRAGVPITLSTDDEGVSRSDLTNEYARAVTEQHLRYADLKQAARNSLQYAFLPGASLWAGSAGGPKAAACTATGPRCTAFLAASEKATMQARLERDLAAFEAMPH